MSDPPLAADVIADAAKTRGRSRHGCPLSCGCVPVSDSGRHRPPPERSRRNPAASNDLTPALNVDRSSQGASPRNGNRAGRGEHPAQGPVPPPVPPAEMVRPSRPWRRDESTDEITHGVQNDRSRGRWRPRDWWTWPHRRRGRRPGARLSEWRETVARRRHGAPSSSACRSTVPVMSAL